MWWWRRNRLGGDDMGNEQEVQRPGLPQLSARAMAEDWLRALTITHEPGIDPKQAMEAVAQVNQPETLRLTIRTPLPAADRQVLDDMLAWDTEARSRQAGVHLLLDGILIDMVAGATGQDRAAVIQRLAIAVERLLPPE
ncbi:hypothetical protein PV646_41205 [Streptomyces sp. ID05-26A]|nr:hypothetical protein [Streptomyces sp. ID05-26A]